MNWGNARRRWRGIVEEQKASGLSVAEFCRRRELAQASFYQWRKKLRSSAGKQAAFVPVSIVDAAAVSIELPGGAVVRVPAGDERALAQVVALLLAAERGR